MTTPISTTTEASSTSSSEVKDVKHNTPIEPPCSSTHIDQIRSQVAHKECEFFQRQLVSEIRRVTKETIRKAEDDTFQEIMIKSQSIPLHTYKYPERKPLPARTAEEWFVDYYKQSEKQRD